MKKVSLKSVKKKPPPKSSSPSTSFTVEVEDPTIIKGQMGLSNGFAEVDDPPDSPDSPGSPEDDDPFPGIGDLDYEDREALLESDPSSADPEAGGRTYQDDDDAPPDPVPVGEAKRGRGRPPKVKPDPINERQANSGQRTPEMPHFNFKSGATPGRRPSDFFRWWEKQPDWVKDRLLVYVYRRWPVIDLKNRNPDPLATTQDPKYIDKRGGMDCITSVDHLIRLWGSGDYTIRINDTVTKKGTIGTCNIDGIRNPEYPPIIEDPGTIVKDDPANKTYIAQLRARGIILPGDEPETKGPTFEELRRQEEEMAAATIVEQVSGQNERLMNRILTMTSEKKDEPESRPSNAHEQSVRLMADTAKQTIEMIRANMGNPKDQVESILAAAERMRPAPAPNPMETLAPFLERMMVQEQTRSTEMAALRAEMGQQQMDMLREQIKMLTVASGRAVVDPATGNLIQTTMPPANPVSSLREQIADYKEMKALFSGDDEEGGGSKGSGSWTDHIPTILQGLTMLGGIVASSLHNMAVAKSGAGQPVAPPPPQPMATPGQTPEQQQQQQQETQSMNEYFKFLDTIKDPLLSHLNNPEKDGIDFAEWLIASRMDGYTFYCGIRDQAGAPGIMALFKSYPPIWDAIKMQEDRVTQFVQEFVERDARLAEEHMEATGSSVAPEPSPVPVNRKKKVII